MSTSFKVSRSVFRGIEEEDSFKVLLTSVGVPLVILSFVKTPNSLLVEVDAKGAESRLMAVLKDLGYPINLIGESVDRRSETSGFNNVGADAQSLSSIEASKQQPRASARRLFAKKCEKTVEAHAYSKDYTADSHDVSVRKTPAVLPLPPMRDSVKSVAMTQSKRSAVATLRGKNVKNPPPIKVTMENAPAAYARRVPPHPPLPIVMRTAARARLMPPDLPISERGATDSKASDHSSSLTPMMPASVNRAPTNPLFNPVISSDSKLPCSDEMLKSVVKTEGELDALSASQNGRAHAGAPEMGESENRRKHVPLVVSLSAIAIAVIGAGSFYRIEILGVYHELKSGWTSVSETITREASNVSDTSDFANSSPQNSKAPSNTKIEPGRLELTRNDSDSPDNRLPSNLEKPILKDEANSELRENTLAPSSAPFTMASQDEAPIASPAAAETINLISAELDRSRTVSFSSYRERHLREDFAVRRGTVREEEYQTELPITLSLCINIDGSVSSVDVIRDGGNSSRLIRLAKKWADKTVWKWNNGSPASTQCGVSLTIL